MPLAGPGTVIAAPPLIAPPNGLLQAATIIEHALLESSGTLSKMVGPDAADTILAAAVMQTAHELFPDDVVVPDGVRTRDALGVRSIPFESDAEQNKKQIDALTFGQREQLRLEIIGRATTAMVAAAQGGMEEGAIIGDGDPFAHWLAGVTWSPESAVALELIDPCGDAGTSKVVFGASGATGVSRLPAVAAAPFVVAVHDSCSTWGWRSSDYVGRATRALAPRETWAVEREFMHGTFMGASRVTAADGVLTNGANTFSSATGKLSQADVGKRITANVAGIPANTFIGTVTSPTTGTLSSSATSNVSVNATATSAVARFTIASKTSGSNRYLSDGNCHIYTTGAVDPSPAQALAYANEAIAKANIGQGMIHVTPFMLEAAAAEGMSMRLDSRGRIVTLNGNIVVPGNGYDGIGPDGTGGTAGDTAGQDSGHDHEWIYVSDLPVIWRPPRPNIFPGSMREAMNVSLNEVTFRAERPYIIAWSALLQSAIKCNILATV